MRKVSWKIFQDALKYSRGRGRIEDKSLELWGKSHLPVRITIPVKDGYTFLSEPRVKQKFSVLQGSLFTPDGDRLLPPCKPKIKHVCVRRPCENDQLTNKFRHLSVPALSLRQIKLLERMACNHNRDHWSHKNKDFARSVCEPSILVWSEWFPSSVIKEDVFNKMGVYTTGEGSTTLTRLSNPELVPGNVQDPRFESFERQ